MRVQPRDRQHILPLPKEPGVCREVKPFRETRLATVSRDAVEVRLPGGGVDGGDTRPVQVGGKAVVVVHLKDERLGHQRLLQRELAPDQDGRRAEGQFGRIILIPIPETGRANRERAVVETDSGPADRALPVAGSEEIPPVGTGLDQYRLEWNRGGRCPQRLGSEGNPVKAGHPHEMIPARRDPVVREGPLVGDVGIVGQPVPAEPHRRGARVVDLDPVAGLPLVVEPARAIRGKDFIQPQAAAC